MLGWGKSDHIQFRTTELESLGVRSIPWSYWLSPGFKQMIKSLKSLLVPCFYANWRLRFKKIAKWSILQTQDPCLCLRTREWWIQAWTSDLVLSLLILKVELTHWLNGVYQLFYVVIHTYVLYVSLFINLLRKPREERFVFTSWALL